MNSERQTEKEIESLRERERGKSVLTSVRFVMIGDESGLVYTIGSIMGASAA